MLKKNYHTTPFDLEKIHCLLKKNHCKAPFIPIYAVVSFSFFLSFKLIDYLLWLSSISRSEHNCGSFHDKWHDNGGTSVRMFFSCGLVGHSFTIADLTNIGTYSFFYVTKLCNIFSWISLLEKGLSPINFKRIWIRFQLLLALASTMLLSCWPVRVGGI